MFQKVPPKSTVGMSIIGIDTKGSQVEGAIEDVKRVDNDVVFMVSGGHEVRQGRTIDLGGAKMNINDIIGRVVKKDKRAGLGFRDDTFFPLGTPEGIAGATPPGMRTITLDATKLTGVHSLNAGDRIDLMASVAESQAATNSKSPNGDVNSLIGATQSSKRGEDQATQPFLLAQDALVLKPVYIRTEAEASSSLTQGKKLQNIPKYEVAIAVKTDDVIPLQSALHKQLAITCIARSMQPGAEATVVSITRFIPAGRTAFAIPWNRIYGGEHLQIGDSIDLLASYSLESEDEEEETETRPDGTKITRKKNSLATRTTERSWEESFGFRGEPWFVASQATVVGPVGFPAPASAMRALAEQATRGNTNSDQNGPMSSGPAIIIAVDELDVESIAAAMATKRALFTVAFHPENDALKTASPKMKRIVLAPEHIDAYETFDESRWKGNRRRPVSRMVQADDLRFATAIAVEDIARYFERTLGQSKRRGDFFASEDFLPRGSAKGISAAAKPGYSIFAIADREIEGLDSFADNDHLAVMVRGVVKPPAGVIAHGYNLSRPVAAVIVPELRVARSSVGGQTILEVRNEDLAILQAALAATLTKEEGNERKRSNLIAVAVSNESNGRSNGPDQSVASTIAGFDPLAGIQTTELIVGGRRQTHAYLDNKNPKSRTLPAVSR